ncbi:MAG TPA: hypothetical protein VK698_38845 [Kofleriaceae bacterium]|nr:hypothetical protein [Kofleriaceae bacterium]
MARSLLRRVLLRGRLPVLVLSLALTGATSSGCVVSPRTAGSIANVATAALWTAAVVGEIALLSYHDSHYHHDHCGHYRRWYGGHWVYYYGGQWEYYDDGASSWYYYQE